MAAEELPVERACELLGVSVSGFYGWRRRPRSARSIRHAWLSAVIGEIHAGSRETYGTSRVHAELTLGRGIAVCRQTVETLTRHAGLRGISGRPKFRKAPNAGTASDLVD
ncbi:MAG: IS3 family transposase [Acidimicrobiaceae bacterium]|nr:IS3 family transposase [Acidimicrobiaceae bacterium]